MKYLHFFVDLQDNSILWHKKISGRQRCQWNKEALAVDEPFLRWIPALIFVLFTPNAMADPPGQPARAKNQTSFQPGRLSSQLCTPGMGVNLWGVSPLYEN